MATKVYRSLLPSDPDLSVVPEALRSAAPALAASPPENPSLWACHIHVGV